MTGSSHVVLPPLLILVLGLFFAPSLRAQLVIKLSSQTVDAFKRYSADIEKQLNERWQGKKNLFFIDDDQQTRQRVLDGEVFIKQMNNGQPVEIKDGLIHDWLGAVFIPHTDIRHVIDLLEDFDKHKNIYPAIADSRTIKRNGDEVTGYWQLKQKNVITVILDVVEEVHYSKLGPGKWKGESRADNINELDSGLFSRGRKFAVGEGHGYLWRLYGYWTLEAVSGGVLAECRTLSLSRDVPQGLAWAVGPYVEKMPQQSLTSTLKETRDAIEKEGQ